MEQERQDQKFERIIGAVISSLIVTIVFGLSGLVIGIVISGFTTEAVLGFVAGIMAGIGLMTLWIVFIVFDIDTLFKK